MKRIMTLFLVFLLVVSFLPTSVSARTLTDEEKALIDYLKEASKILDDGTRDIASALVQGENYIAALSTPLTEKQISLIKAEVEKAVAAAKTEESGNVMEWSEETRNEVLDCVDDAAQIVGCTAVVDVNGKESVKDNTGKTIVATNEVIKPTGMDAGSSFVFASVVLSLLLACAYVSKKVELF
ncbi:MAG: hypothetical protein IKT50_05220 [Clostridia bacterium]|nr:hypothetical protein [Clostridia bacterium]